MGASARVGHSGPSWSAYLAHLTSGFRIPTTGPGEILENLDEHCPDVGSWNIFCGNNGGLVLAHEEFYIKWLIAANSERAARPVYLGYCPRYEREKRLQKYSCFRVNTK